MGGLGAGCIADQTVNMAGAGIENWELILLISTKGLHCTLGERPFRASTHVKTALVQSRDLGQRHSDLANTRAAKFAHVQGSYGGRRNTHST